MSIDVKYESKNGVPGKRYVARSSNGRYRWCVQDAKRPRFDVSQGFCDVEDLPKDVVAKCDTYDGVHYACEWPI